MSANDSHADDLHHEKHTSIRPMQYLGIAVVLGIITAFELWIASFDVFRTAGLIILTIAKATLVALWYMHLRFDSRLYSTMFTVAIFVFAVPMTLVLLILFQFIGF